MQNDSVTDFLQTTAFDYIFQKQDDWYKLMMKHYQEISETKALLDKSRTEEEYETRWNKWNEAYHWWLIRMDQHLCQYDTQEHNIVHQINYKCFLIGGKTGYWNNKYSRILYDWFQNHHTEIRKTYYVRSDY